MPVCLGLVSFCAFLCVFFAWASLFVKWNVKLYSRMLHCLLLLSLSCAWLLAGRMITLWVRCPL